MANNNNYSKQKFSKMISQSIAQSVYNVTKHENSSKQISSKEISSLRQQYVDVFNHQQNEFVSEPNWWIEVFRKTGDDLLELIKKDLPQNNNNVSGEFSIKCGCDQPYKFTDRKVILMGRRTGCDVQFPSIRIDTSRLHAIVYLLPEINKIAVVDVGSLSGIQTVERSSGKECERSEPDSRRVLMFEWNEYAKFEFGSLEVAFNLKECVICMDNLREIKFGCGHYAACKECADKLQECPICRQVIVSKKPEFHYKTHVCNS